MKCHITRSSKLFVVLAMLVCALVLPGLCGCNRGDSDNQSDKAQETGSTSVELDSVEEEILWGGLSVKFFGIEPEKASCFVVLLHGLGANASDLIPLAKAIEVDPSTCFVFPDAPFEMGDRRRAWFRRPNDFEHSVKSIELLLDYINEKYSDSKIILGGYSQGAILSSNLTSQDPQLLSGLVLLSPSGQVRRPPKDIESKPLVFMAHGRSDQILPFQRSATLHDQLLEANFDVEWVPFDGGHEVPNSLIPRISRFVERIQKTPR